MPYYRVTSNDWRRALWLENLDAADFWGRLAIKETKDTFGEDVSIDLKRKTLLKFGKTPFAGGSTEVTIANFSSDILMENYSTSNSISYIASASTADTGAVVVEGHTIDSDGAFTFVTQSVTLNGQTKTALTTPLARSTRVYNNSASNWSGNVYIAEDVTFTAGVPATGIHLIGIASDNQSQKCATTFSNTDYYFITQAFVDIDNKTAATADVRLKIRHKGKVFRTRWEAGVDTASARAVTESFRPYIVVPANADVIMTAHSTAAANNVKVTANFNGILAKVA